MNRIITAKSSQLKALARQALAEYWKEALIFVLVCHLIINVPAIIYDALPEDMQLPIVASLLNFYSIAINGPISLCLTHYFMGLFRQEKRSCQDELKFGFRYILNGLLLYVRMALFTALWSMLFVIPGFIALIRYSQSFMILADDPSKTPAKCMTESCIMMRGNKMKFFEMILSFIPWFILAAIPSLVAHTILDWSSIAAMTQALNENNLELAMTLAYDIHPVATALEFLDIIPRTYLNVAMVAFFDILCGKLVIETQTESEPNNA